MITMTTDEVPVVDEIDGIPMVFTIKEDLEASTAAALSTSVAFSSPSPPSESNERETTDSLVTSSLPSDVHSTESSSLSFLLTSIFHERNDHTTDISSNDTSTGGQTPQHETNVTVIATAMTTANSEITKNATDAINDAMTTQVPTNTISIPYYVDTVSTPMHLAFSNDSSSGSTEEFQSVTLTSFQETTVDSLPPEDNNSSVTMESHLKGTTSSRQSSVEDFYDNPTTYNATALTTETQTVANATNITTTTDYFNTTLTTSSETTINTSDDNVSSTTVVYVSKETTTSQYSTGFQGSTLTFAPHGTFCDNSNSGAVMWLGVPVFWWIIAAGVFITILMMIVSFCIYVGVSKRKWRKRSHQRRGYTDDQLTSSFIQSYSNPEVTPTNRNNKATKKEKAKKPKSSYPKSYLLGPKLLPFPADAVRLKPSNCSSVASTPTTFNSNKLLSTNGKLSQEFFNDKNSYDPKNKLISDNKEANAGEEFGTWRKPGPASFGGFIPGYKRPIFLNQNENDNVDKKSKKSIDDDVFEEGTLNDSRELSTFSYRNNLPNQGSTTTFKS